MSFQESKAGRVYNVLILRTDRVVSTASIREACRLLGVGFQTAFVGLSRAGVLEPVIFKGVYYVRKPDERQLGTMREDSLDVIARACNLALKEDWYFGLATALKLAGLWEQQTLATITVVCKKRVKKNRANFGGFTVEFKQLTGVPFDKLVAKSGVKRFSQPARTLADYAYFNARAKQRDYPKIVRQDVYAKTGDKKKLEKQLSRLIKYYPKPYAKLMLQLLEVGEK